MFCPSCRAEYVPGVEACPDCEAVLVHELRDEPEREIEWAELMTLTDETEAQMACGFLESEGVPCNLESLVFHAEPFKFGPLAKVRLHVPRADLERARKLLSDQLSGSTSTPVP